IAVLRTTSRERDAAEVMPLLQGVSERSRRRCHRRVGANVLTDLSQECLRKFLEFLLSDSGDLCELAFTLWTRLRHLAERCIGKDNISRDIALVRDLSAQRAQTLEKFFIAFDFASPWGADLLCWRLDRLG